MSDKVVLDAEDMRRTLVRISHEIVEKTGGSRLAVVGIHRRGAVLAQRVRDLVAELVGEPIPLGDIDISFYRDDVATRNQPTVHAVAHRVPDRGDDRRPGRRRPLHGTHRARRRSTPSFDYGRPACVQLALVAHGGPRRKLPSFRF